MKASIHLVLFIVNLSMAQAFLDHTPIFTATIEYPRYWFVLPEVNTNEFYVSVREFDGNQNRIVSRAKLKYSKASYEAIPEVTCLENCESGLFFTKNENSSNNVKAYSQFIKIDKQYPVVVFIIEELDIFAKPISLDESHKEKYRINPHLLFYRTSQSKLLTLFGETTYQGYFSKSIKMPKRYFEYE